MRRDGKSHRSWTKSDSETAQEVRSELLKRELSDLETCRQVWIEERDPMALLEAVRQIDLPDWLQNALVAALVDGAGEGYELDGRLSRKRAWAKRHIRRSDAMRALNVASVRTHPELPNDHKTWDWSYLLGESLANSDGAPKVGMDAAKKSYDKVRRELKAHPFRFYRHRNGLDEFVKKASLADLKAHAEAIREHLKEEDSEK